MLRFRRNLKLSSRFKETVAASAATLICKRMVKKGFYYHNKHDPEKGIFDAAYEVLGTAFNTESGGAVHSDDPADFLADEVVVYRPLFRGSMLEKNGRDFWVRPIAMFAEPVVKDGVSTMRFIEITDPSVIAELEKMRDMLYT